MDKFLNDDLVAFLKKEGEKAVGDLRNAVYFRNVEEKLENIFAEAPVNELLPEIFSFYLFLEHVLTVTTGDVRYHGESIKYCDKIFVQMAELIDALSEVVKQTPDSSLKFKEKMDNSIIIYLDSVRKINDLLEKRQ